MAVNPLAVIILPTVYILVAVLALMQFSVVLSLLATAAVKVRAIPLLDPIEPVLITMIEYLQRVFGPLNKFNPQPTHIFLVAIVVALIAHSRR